MYLAHVILRSLRRLLELEWGICVESFLEKMNSGELRAPTVQVQSWGVGRVCPDVEEQTQRGQKRWC